MRKYFGTDGVRGVVNEELTAELAFKIGKSTAYVLKNHNHSLKNILIARDTRISGEMLEASLVSSILSMGFNVVTCGVMPTPVLAWLTKKENTVGFMVSASHNPWTDNGIKIFSNGYKLPDELEEEIEDHMDGDTRSRKVGKLVKNDMVSEYIEWLSERYSELKGMKVAFDLANGAAVSTVPSVAEKIGIVPVIFNSNPDGMNINEGVGALHPEFLSERISGTGAQLGVIHDGDADRCIIVSKNGHIIDGDDMLVINGLNMKKEGRLGTNTVVGTVMTNLAIEEALKGNGINFLRTKVGDRYVLEEMMKINSKLGGEQSGHVIFLDLETTGDGLLTALETMRALVRLGVDPEEFSKMITRYPQKLVNVKVNDKNTVMKNQDLAEFVEKTNSEKGLRIVLRPSGTEQVIRVMVEGTDHLTVEDVVERATELVKEVSTSGEVHKG